jgi:hypothetical protein
MTRVLLNHARNLPAIQILCAKLENFAAGSVNLKALAHAAALPDDAHTASSDFRAARVSPIRKCGSVPFEAA